MIGLAVGIISGAFQYWLLSKFTSRITKGTIDLSAALLGMLQLFFPGVILVGMAFIKRSDLPWTAIGLAGCLILCAIIKFAGNMRKTRGRKDDNN